MNFQHLSSHVTPALLPTPLPIPHNAPAGRTAPSPSLLFRNESEAMNQRRMKQFVQEIRFKEKMQAINRKKGKYKRSTNNCHKKYIGILKNLLFLKLSPARKDYILSQYNQYKNSRVYYFIILCHLKWTLEPGDIRWIFQHFCQQVEGKINRYKLEISTTNNSNFIHFRKDEIIEMEYSIQSINFFLRGEVEQAIRVLYQKNKYIIIKRNEYLRTVEIIKGLEEQLRRDSNEHDITAKMAALNLAEVFRWNRNVNFHQLESIERLSKRRSRELREERDARSSSESADAAGEEIEGEGQGEVRQGEASCEVAVAAKTEGRIKEQAQSGQGQGQGQGQGEKFPLLQLQNSYTLITELGWHSWIIQKQKIMEFQLRNREQELKRSALAFNRSPQRSNFSRMPNY